MSATKDLKQDHLTLRRVRDITQRCSERLYSGENIPIEDIEIISVVIEEFVDAFHHGKEEKAYFPETKDKNGFAEDIRKFLIEHELGRRIATMLLRELKEWKDKREGRDNDSNSGSDDDINITSREPVARFLKSYAVFISDHTGKEDKFFDLIEEKGSISKEDEQMLMKHYESCKNDVGGSARIEQMLKLIDYLEDRDWMK
ncbi:MAG: hemerythrin domain-containing protein [Nitrososphaeraceae archaeon]|nr:hemerythrin domain-containing protein [Nitrososphaeraceae archaeon]